MARKTRTPRPLTNYQFIQTFADRIILTGATAQDLDGYAKRGVALSRDAASVVIAALHRDADEMEARSREANPDETRGGEANRDAAALNRTLADNITHNLLS